MKFVKFTAKENTWFKSGTEVLFEDDSFICRRPTIDEYDNIKKDLGAVFVGVHICDDKPNEINLGYRPGDERIDGEWCPLEEFDIEFVDTDYRNYN